MALAIYEGTKKDQLVDEIVDEEILRLLGLENVNDLDYDDYKTLLRERVAAGRMPGNDIPTEDTERLTEEFKRVKKETGKLKVKNNKIKFNSVVSKATKKTKPASNPTKTLMGSNVEPEEEVQVQSGGSQDIMEFLTAVVAPSLTKIENSLENILGSLTNQQKLQSKISEKERISGEKEKKKQREEKSESGIFKKLGDGAKKIASPLGGIFASIKKFFMAILGGIVSLGLIDLFTDPEKFFRNLANGVIDFFNGVIKSIYDNVIRPINKFIDNINKSIFEKFANDVNKALDAIDFLDVIPEIPTFKIPLIPLLEIPRIEPPEAEPEPMKVPGMEGGGEVTNITNKYYELMEGGGKVTTNTGNKISSMGSDTQMVALTPGEVVMSKKAVDAYGADTLLGMNADAGGTNKPKMGMVPGYQGGGMVGGSKYDSLLSFISKGEGGYNSMNQGTQGNSIVGSTHNASTKVGKNLTSMTIGEVMQRQSYLMNPNNPQVSDYGIFAAGRYQIIPSTMSEILPQSGLSKDDMFSKQNQDTLGITLITKKQPRVGDYINGNGTIDGAMDALSNEFASMPDPRTGNSKYGGGNKALHTVEEVKQALIQAKTGSISPQSTTTTPTPGQSTGDAAPYEFSLDDVKPMQSPTSQRPMIGVPGGGGGSSVVVAGGGGAQQQSPSSASGGAQSSAPMFSPIDQNNPDLLVIKSIYSIV